MRFQIGYYTLLPDKEKYHKLLKKVIVFEEGLSEQSIKSHIIRLHQLALIDDLFVKEERRFLYALGRKNGIDESTVNQYLSASENTKFSLPKTDKEKIILLYEYIKMMLVDNKLDEREAKMCMLLAERMGFAKDLVNGITKAIVTAEADNVAPVLTEKQLERYIENPDSI